MMKLIIDPKKTNFVYEAAFSRIMEAVSKETGIPEKSIRGDLRFRPTIQARHLVMWFARNTIPNIPLRAVGELCGNGKCKDYSTVSAACVAIDRRLSCRTAQGKIMEKELHDLVARIEVRLFGQGIRLLPRYFLELMQ